MKRASRRAPRPNANRAACALLAVLVASSLALAAAPAAAQSPEDRESARRLFEEGKTRRDHGDAAGALESFRAADALMNVPTTKLAVARAYQALGKLVEARDAAMAVAQIPSPPTEPTPFIDARTAAAQLATQLAGRIPSIAIAFHGDAPASLGVDGEGVPRDAWSTPRRVNAGKHTVVAKRAGREVSAQVTVAEGESASVTLDTSALPADEAAATGSRAPSEAPSAPSAASAATSASRPLGPVFWIGAGLGAAGLMAGGVAGGISLANKSSADAFCRDAKCPPPAYPSLDAASTWATVSTVGFVAAGVGAAVAVVGLVLRPASATPTSAALWIRPGGAALLGSF
jgi:hypothetical protein